MPAIRYSEQEFKRIVRQEGYGVLNAQDAASRGPTAAHRALMRARDESLEAAFQTLWGQLEGPGVWVRNLRFDLPDSRMELDFAMPEIQVAVEVNGGQAKGDKSGHGNWEGLARDARKQRQAAKKGWTLFWLPTSMVTAEEVQKIIDIVREKLPGK